MSCLRTSLTPVARHCAQASDHQAAQTEVEVTDELIAAFHDEILEAIENGTPAQKKAISPASKAS